MYESYSIYLRRYFCEEKTECGINVQRYLYIEFTLLYPSISRIPRFAKLWASSIYGGIKLTADDRELDWTVFYYTNSRRLMK
jgi:hypothetical protein